MMVEQPPFLRRLLPSALLYLALGLIIQPAPCADALLAKKSNVRGTAAHEAHGHKKHRRLKKKGVKKEGADVYYAVELLDKLKTLTDNRLKASETKHANELVRLGAASELAVNRTDKDLLTQAMLQADSARSETQGATTEMLSFYYSVKALLGSQGAPPPSCDYMKCGENAACHNVPDFGALCKCKSCFKGDGYECMPATCSPVKYTGAMPLIALSAEETPVNVAEMQVSIFGDDYFAVVFRDTSRKDRGFVQLGHVSDMGVATGKLQSFSGNDPAFGPVVTAHDNGRLVITYRDKDRGGSGYILGGFQNNGLNGLTLEATLQPPYAFAKEQAQKMVLVPLSASRAVCLYSGHVPSINTTAADGSTDTTPSQAFGGVLLVQMLHGGTLSILGKYRFADGFGAISRLAATSMSPDSLVVAYRALPLYTDEENPHSHELSASYITMKNEELVISGHTLELEPQRGQMWARSVGMVSQNLFAYSYQSGSEKLTKVAMIHVDPATHAMSQAGDAHVIGEGDAEFVQAITLATGLLQPHTFTYFQHPGNAAFAEVCPISADGEFGDCGKASFASHELRTASGVKLKDGRLLFVYAKMDGSTYSDVFGVELFLGR